MGLARDWRDLAGFELDAAAEASARSRVESLGIPIGSLGLLHDLAIRLAGIAGSPRPHVDNCRVIVFSADHGVARRDVSAFPRLVTDTNTRRMAEGTATISVLARALGADVTVVDVGVDAEPLAPSITNAFQLEYLDRKIRRGSGDIVVEPAMTIDELNRTLQIGFEIAVEKAEAADLIVFGDMGIGNTTVCSALIAAFYGASADSVTGYGSGIDETKRRAKINCVERSVARFRAACPEPTPVEYLAQLGGLELAAIAGGIIGAASRRVPVVLDGLIVSTAALLACRMVPGLERALIPGTVSADAAFLPLAGEFGQRPILDLGMRLGEGTAALLCFPILKAAVQQLHAGSDMVELVHR